MASSTTQVLETGPLSTFLLSCAKSNAITLPIQVTQMDYTLWTSVDPHLLEAQTSTSS